MYQLNEKKAEDEIRETLEGIKHYVTSVEELLSNDINKENIDNLVTKASIASFLVLRLNQELLKEFLKMYKRKNIDRDIERTYIADLIEFLENIGYLRRNGAPRLCSYINEKIKDMEQS